MFPCLKELQDEYSNVLNLWKFTRQILDLVRHHAGG